MTDDASRTPMDARRRALLERLRAERGLDATASSIARRPPSDRGRASFAQERAWFLCQLDHERSMQNVTKAFRMSGRLEVRSLERTLSWLVARHEVLRTGYEASDGDLFQVIHPPPDLAIELASFTTLDAGAREAAVSELVAREAGREVDLVRGPVLRAVLAALGPDDHILVLTVHHIAADGWSAGLLVGELCAAYTAFTLGGAPDHPPLPVQYADFAAWQREPAQRAHITRGVEAFRSRLHGAPPPPELPASHPAAMPRTHAGGEVAVVLGGPLESAIARFARDRGVTVFEILLAAYAVVIQRYTGASQLIIGTPFANRARRELEGVIGLFATTIALHIDLTGRPSFESVTTRIRSEVRLAANHQDVPFHEVVQVLRPERSSASPTPLFRVWFALQNWPMPKLQLPGLTVTAVPAPAQTVEFDLSLDLWTSGGQLGGRLEFSRDLFTDAAAARIAGHFRTLLASALAHPESPIADLALYDPRERRSLLTAGRGPDRDAPLIMARIAEQVRVRGAEPAAIVGDVTLSFAELDRRSDALARRLRAQGAGPERLVAVILPPGLDLAVSLLAVLKTGAAFLPLDGSSPPARTRVILDDARPIAVITEDTLGVTAGGAEDLPRGIDERSEIAGVGDPDGFAGGAGDLPRGIDEQLAYVFYTSGSTGVPKGVAVSHRCLAAYTQAAIDAFRIRSADRMLQFAPVGFDVLIEELFPLWAAGGSVVFRGKAEPIEPAALMALVTRHAVTMVELPNLYWQLVADERDAGSLVLPPSLRMLLVGCGALPTARVRSWRSTGVELVHVYGLTEVTVTSTACDPTTWSLDDHPWPRLPLGRPIGGARVYVLDANLVPLPVGARGEIYLGGDLVARGYLGAPEATAERFVPDPFDGRPGARMVRTGDAARWLEDGTIDFLGRLDEQIKVRGFRVELAEVEGVLAAHPDVREAAVIATRDDHGDHRLTAFVAVRSRAFDPRSLREHLRARLPAYMCPSELVEIDAVPRSTHGKLDRTALRAMARTPRPIAHAAAPTTPSERAVAEVWRELFGLDHVTAGDDFFELGGHSLLATRMAARLRRRFSIDLSIRAIFDAPVLADLAAAIDLQSEIAGGGDPDGVAGGAGGLPRRIDERSGRPTSPIPRRPSGARAPASFAQEHLWFLHRMDPHSAAYNLPTGVRIRGAVDVAALRVAFRRVVERHEILRTVFVERDGRVDQCVQPDPSAELRVADVSDAADPERSLAGIARQDATLVFDLEHGPLVRATLVRLDVETHALLLTLHHIVADAWSLGIIVDELTCAYETIVSAAAVELPRIPVQFADVAVWQRGTDCAARMVQQLAYWGRQLLDCDHGSELPPDFPRPPVPSGLGATVGFEIDPQVATALRSMVREHRVTLAAVLLAGFAALLRRRGETDDVAIGVPIANRQHPDTEALIGYFLNTVVIRGSVAARESFAAVAARIHAALIAAQAHADVPFDRVVDALGPARDLSHHPLFQIMFSFEQRDQRRRSNAGLVLEPHGVHTGTAQFDLTLDVVDADGALSGVFCFATELYRRDTIEALVAEYLALLTAASGAPGRPLAELWRLDTAARRTLVVDWNATEVPRSTAPDLGELIRASARRVPQALAVIAPGETLTYADLAARADALARQLHVAGVRNDDVVAVIASRGSGLAVACAGTWFAGGAFLPLDPTQPAERLARCLQDARPRAIVMIDEVAVDPDARVPIVRLSREARPVGPISPTSLPAAPASCLAYVTFTSGSTGVPKAVAVPHTALVNFARDMAGRMELGPQDRVFQFAPVAFDVLLEELLPAWSAGAAIVFGELDPIPLPGDLLAAIERTTTTHVELPARYWEQLVAELPMGQVLPARLRMVLLGCDPPSAASIRAWSCHRVPLLHVFGLTETAVTSTTWPVALEASAGERAASPIGRPISNTTTYVLDQALEPVPVGVPGELYIGGQGLARGYLHRPDLTADRFVPDPFATEPGRRLYRTGDRARFRANGALEFLGRYDDQVKIRGFRVELGEVETALLRQPGVREAAAWTETTLTGAVRLVAAVAATGQDLDAQRVRTQTAAIVPAYMVPSTIWIVDALPRTSSGKLDRTQLRALALEPSRSSGAEPLRDDISRRLAAIWSAVLALPAVALDDNFFDVGGDSLSCLAVVARARSAGLELSPRDVFQHQTLRELAAMVRRQPGRGGVESAARFVRAKLSAVDLDRFFSHLERGRS